MWNGSAWLTATTPITQTDTLYRGDLLQRDLNLYITGDGRTYDPRLGKYLQPDPIGGPPLLPQAADRYQYAGNSPTGVGGAASGGGGFGTEVLLAAIGETPGAIVSDLGRVTARSFIYGTKTAMYRAVQANAGVRAVLGQGASGWIQRARRTPNDVLGLAPPWRDPLGRFAGEQFELFGASRLVRPDEFGGLLRGNFDGAAVDWVQEYRGWRGFLAQHELAVGIGIDMAVEALFQLNAPYWSNPYLTPGQKAGQFIINVGFAGFTSGATYYTLIAIGVTGGPVGIIVAIGVGTAYSLIFSQAAQGLIEYSGANRENMRLRPLGGIP